MNRRQWIAIGLGAFGAAGLGALSRAGSASSSSRSASKLPSRIRIAPMEEPGERLILTGRVLGADGSPRAGVEIDAYHTDSSGLYRRDRETPKWPGLPPRLEGRLSTATDGSYEIDTIKPGPYPGGQNPAHIHFHLRIGAIDRGPNDQAETLWFEGDPLLSAELVARESRHGTFSAIRPVSRGADGMLRCTRDFRLRTASASGSGASR